MHEYEIELGHDAIMFVPVRLAEGARLPQRANDHASGYDLYAYCPEGKDRVLKPGHTVVIETGVSIELPLDCLIEAQVRPRSGMSKSGMLVHLGTIDRDYRGPIAVVMTNLSMETVFIKPEQRIAQLVFAPVVFPNLIEALALKQTARGANGFGSTGK